MRSIAKAGVIAWACYLTGCVGIDARVGELTGKPFRSGVTLAFANQPTYITKQGLFEGRTDFTTVLGLFYRAPPKADLITLRLLDGVGLAVKLTRQDEVLFEKTYRLGEEIEIAEGGKIVLRPQHGGQGLGGYGIALAKRQVTLFLDGDDNLVAVESTDTLAIFLVVPIPGHSQLVSIFPRIR